MAGRRKNPVEGRVVRKGAVTVVLATDAGGPQQEGISQGQEGDERHLANRERLPGKPGPWQALGSDAA